MPETLPSPYSLAEMIHPRHTPEMGFQSYEALKGDGEYRKGQQAAFLDDQIARPMLDYPELDETELKRSIRKLDTVLESSSRHGDAFVGDAVWDSAGYRMAEIYWLLSSERLIRTYPSLDDDQIDTLAAQTQELNEQLYGKPEKELTEAIHAEIWAQLDRKKLVGRAATIKEELEQGTSTFIADEFIKIPPLARTTGERLPTISSELLNRLREKLYQENSDIVEVVQNYWSQVIQQRPEDERSFTAKDMLWLFHEVHHLRDPYNESGVAIIEEPGATALSWDTSVMAVKIGGRRAPIDAVDTMISKIFHEYVVHGGRAIHGSKTKLPVLGTGLYTEADPGELSDYLTFEEGFATMCEMAIDPKNQSWSPQSFEKSLGLGLAYEGNDFRQTFETLWRARLLMTTKSGEEPTETMVTKARKNAYTSVVRIFRGTPTEMPRGNSRVLTYNKDLAYLKGRLSVIDFHNRYPDDPQMLDLAFKAKFDPLNRRQLALVQEAERVV
ncbi:hypothetical protein TM7_0452 [candidate division TM7 genomosp. GTL1]|nr:hypothetical protein TM7_0452 [candidate division TM7 genomosp. GTL1]